MRKKITHLAFIIFGLILMNQGLHAAPDTLSCTFFVYSKASVGCHVYVTYSGNAGSSATYNWNFDGGVIMSGSGPGPYYIYWLTADTLDIALSVFENGCSSSTTIVPVIIFPPPVPAFTPNPQTTYIENPLINFYDHSLNTIIWSWDFGDTASGTDNYSAVQSPSHTYSGEGTYPVLLIVTSPDGCIDSIIQFVNILDLTTLFVPNAFTPNGDGINDIFQPYSTDIDYKLSIYDRWGERLFEADNQGWDGKYEGKKLKSDVYVWCLIYTQKQLQKKIAIGHVTLLR